MTKVSMPSNIALIKYMGKKPDTDGKNVPTNPSLSYTLDYLSTTVTLEPITTESRWEPLDSSHPLKLSAAGQARFVSHLEFLKETLDLPEKGFLIKSGNNFPSDCGIASSASSFAALTEAVCKYSEAKTPVEERAWLSSQGSGSSCRSFFKGWVLWDTDKVKTAKTAFENLRHMVVLVSEDVKKVSSSEAHKRVATSDLSMERTHRAEKRLDAFNEGLDLPSWSQLYQLAWAEFWDMHALFETSKPAFGYMQPATMSVLQAARKFWEAQGDGPLVTMDAGPNVHLLWRKDQAPLAMEFFNQNLKGQFSCLSDLTEIGFARV